MNFELNDYEIPNGGQPKTSPLALVGVICFILLAIGGAVGMVYYLVVKPAADYQVKVSSFGPYTREFGQPPVSIPLEEEIFSPQKVKDYRNGEGFSFELIKKFKGKVDSKITIELKPWDEHLDGGRGNRDKRLADVQKKRESARKLIEAFNSDEPRKWSLLLFLDGTSGTGPQLTEGVNQGFASFAIAELLKNGDTATVQAIILNSSGTTEIKEVSVTRDESELQPLKEWLLKKRTDEGNSALATGIFNVLSQTENPYTKLVIISDGLENSVGTTNFYAKKDQLIKGKTDKAEWQKIAGEIQRQKAAPDLSGKEVLWILYPTPGSSDELIFAAEGFWTWFLTEQAGTVKTKVMKLN